MSPAVPENVITPWSGAIANIPSGWSLCDGNNGTPDLRNKFIVGAGDTYDPDDTGGATPHDHPFTGDGHVHPVNPGVDVNAGTDYATTTTSTAIAGTTDTTSSCPKYWALAYIMYTG